MPIDSEDSIRNRAYALWEQAGRPDGQDKDFWSLAEHQLSDEAGLDISDEAAEARPAPIPAGLPAH